MFSQFQMNLIQTGRYSAAFFYDINLPSGTQYRWTTFGRDHAGYSADNPITAADPLKNAGALGDNRWSIEMAASIGILSAFDKCQGASVAVQIGIESGSVIELTQVFSGVIGSYKITRTDKTRKLLLEITDRLGAINAKKPRSLTPAAQERLNNDQCLKYMASSEESIYWGKEA